MDHELIPEMEIMEAGADISNPAFCVGDEVQYNSPRPDARRFVVTSFRKGILCGIGPDGIGFADKDISKWHKTGNFFPEAPALIRAMQKRILEGVK